MAIVSQLGFCFKEQIETLLFWSKGSLFLLRLLFSGAADQKRNNHSSSQPEMS